MHTAQGDRYFPDDAGRREDFTPSSSRTSCPIAAWYYPHPSRLARKIKFRLADCKRRHGDAGSVSLRWWHES
jgi:uncharacterized protein (DUF427 family)